MAKKTLKEILVDRNSASFHEAFGISEERGDEIIEIIQAVSEKIVSGQGEWSPSGLIGALADFDVATTTSEIAFVMFLVGCKTGEEKVVQALAGGHKGMAKDVQKMILNAQFEESIRKKKKKDETIH